MDNFTKLIILFLISSPVFALSPINLTKSVGAGSSTNYKFGSSGESVSSVTPSTGSALVNNFSVAQNQVSGLPSYITDMTPVVQGVVMKVEATQDVSWLSLAKATAEFVFKTLNSSVASVGADLSKYLSDNGILKDPSTNQYGSSSPHDVMYNPGCAVNGTNPKNYSPDYICANNAYNGWFDHGVFAGFNCSPSSPCVNGNSSSSSFSCVVQANENHFNYAVGSKTSIIGYCNAPAPVCAAAGGSMTVDGKCQASTYTPYTQTQIQTSLQAHNPTAPSGVVKDLLTADPSGASLPVADGSIDVTVPTPSFSKAPVKTVTPDGKVQTSTDTVNLTKVSPDTVQATVDTVVNTLLPDGSSISSTITNAPKDKLTDPSLSSDPKTDCEKFPNSVGCSEYGSAPVPDVIETVQRQFSLSPTSLGSGSCPAPNIVHLSKTTLTMSYQPYCDFALMISPVVIAIAWFSAGLIVLSPIKNS